ncbi:hypothetical protein SUDANB99_01593 [Streptomyces sp. enrichment culture]
MGEWKQGKCGWPIQGGRRCSNLTMKGTSRCWRHQGEWTKRGQTQQKKAGRRPKK